MLNVMGKIYEKVLKVSENSCWIVRKLAFMTFLLLFECEIKAIQWENSLLLTKLPPRFAISHAIKIELSKKLVRYKYRQPLKREIQHVVLSPESEGCEANEMENLSHNNWLNNWIMNSLVWCCLKLFQERKPRKFRPDFVWKVLSKLFMQFAQRKLKFLEMFEVIKFSLGW